MKSMVFTFSLQLKFWGESFISGLSATTCVKAEGRGNACAAVSPWRSGIDRFFWASKSCYITIIQFRHMS